MISNRNSCVISSLQYTGRDGEDPPNIHDHQPAWCLQQTTHKCAAALSLLNTDIVGMECSKYFVYKSIKGSSLGRDRSKFV